jgi:L-alanine-DL-glutamate epimerase-like enolase superfamily enzyme
MNGLPPPFVLEVGPDRLLGEGRTFRRFALVRLEDEGGVSGTGVVAFGVEFPSGVCTLDWNTGHKSQGVYPSLAELVAIHGHGGKTVVHFLDGS